MNRYIFLLFLLVAFSCRKAPETAQDVLTPSPMMCVPVLSDADWYTQNTPAPLLEGMDVIHYPVTTTSAEAQKYFDQGLLLSYAFNHAEAARSFYQASRLDSTCAMCYWGFAFVLGPNYNAGMEADHYARAYTAIQKAVALSDKVTPKEKVLINAMALRYTPEAPADRRSLDSAYMVAMKQAHLQFPDDVDIAALYAESLMDMHPWDLWNRDGTPKPWTPEILKAIEVSIRINPRHPGGHHYYIHALEASPYPEKALASAKVFDDGLVSHAGHLVHMPSHIYINTGDYHLGSLANINALKQDSLYVTQCHAFGAYPLAYYPHNYHFLAATATLEGKYEWAIDAAEKMAQHVNHKGMLIPDLATLQHFYSIPYFIRVKFGKWDEILRIGPPDSALIYPMAIRHYARGMAFASKKDLNHAREELDALRAIGAMDTLQKLTIWGINSLASITTIAQDVLEAEIAAASDHHEDAIRLLRDAVTLEDQLNYNEPPDWFFSVRHLLGDELIRAGKAEEAIGVFEEDLNNFPKNGWALSGLALAQRESHQPDKADATEKLFKEAWAYADVELDGSVVAEEQK